MKLILVFLLITVALSLYSKETIEEKKDLLVFYKNRAPSLKVLEKVRPVVESFSNNYNVQYVLIEEEDNQDIINRLRLPSTHFPFAVVIDGKYSAQINQALVSFVHFPTFMHGIGRHEGNWSLDDLQAVLKDNSMLLMENVLPVLDQEKETTKCED